MARAGRVVTRLTLAIALAAISAVAAPADAQPAPADPSPHRSATVAVGGARIHYLDWGGTGPALVFIPGMGHSAHVFDDFGPRFLDGFRVVAITRIGFGESSAPDSAGYDLASRVAHVAAVLDSLAIPRAILVGHSLGGDEITAFARAHPARTTALVYLDAAYDHAASIALRGTLAEFQAGAPRPAAADLASAEAWRRWQQREFGFLVPIGEALAIVRFDSSGAAVAMRASPRVMQATLAATERLDYAGVRAPALALYADWTRAKDVMPWLAADSALEARATGVLRATYGSLLASERARFAREVPGGWVDSFRIGHYMPLIDPAETERRMRAFLATVPGAGPRRRLP